MHGTVPDERRLSSASKPLCSCSEAKFLPESFRSDFNKRASSHQILAFSLSSFCAPYRRDAFGEFAVGFSALCTRCAITYAYTASTSVLQWWQRLLSVQSCLEAAKIAKFTSLALLHSSFHFFLSISRHHLSPSLSASGSQAYRRSTSCARILAAPADETSCNFLQQGSVYLKDASTANT